MDKKRSSNMAAEIEKMPASTGAVSLVPGWDLPVPGIRGVDYQVARRPKGILTPLVCLPGQDSLIRRHSLQRLFPAEEKRCFFINYD